MDEVEDATSNDVLRYDGSELGKAPDALSKSILSPNISGVRVTHREPRPAGVLWWGAGFLVCTQG